MAYVASFAALAYGAYYYETANKRAIKSAEQVKDVLSQSTQTFKNHQSTVENISKSYDTLKKGVQIVNGEYKNLSLSDADYQSFLDMNNQLADIFPSLIKDVDTQGNKILDLGNNGETATSQLDELLQKEKELLAIDFAKNMPELTKGIAAEINQYKGDFGDKSKEDRTLKSSQTVNDALVDISTDKEYNGIMTSLDRYAEPSKQFVSKLKEVDKQFAESLTDEEKQILTKSKNFYTEDLQNPNEDGTVNIGLSALTFVEGQEDTEAAQALREKYSEYIKNVLVDVKDDVGRIVTDTLGEQNQNEASIKSAWKDYLGNLVSSLGAHDSYNTLDDNVKDIVQDMVKNIDISNLDEITSLDDPYTFVRENIIPKFDSLSKTDTDTVQLAYKKLLTLDPDSLASANQSQIDKYVNILAEKLQSSPIEIRTIFGFDQTELQNKFDTVKNSAIYKYAQQDDGTVNEATKSRISDFMDKNVHTNDDIVLFNQIKNSIKDAEKAMKLYTKAKQASSDIKLFDKSQMIDAINGLSDGFDILDKIYADVKNGDVFDFANLDKSKFTEAFKDLDEEYTNFIEKVSSSPNDLKGCQDAFNELAGAFVEHSGIFEQITDENAQLAVSMLKNQGIANADVIVWNALTANKELEALKTADITNMTYEEVQALIAETATTDEARIAMNRYYLEKLGVNNVTLQTSGDIKNIMSLVQACGGGITALKSLADAKREVFSNMQALAINKAAIDNGLGLVFGEGNQTEQLQNNLDASINDFNSRVTSAMGEVQTALNGSNNTNYNYEYAGANDSNKSSGSGSDGSNENSAVDWIERQIKLLEDERTRLEDKLNDTFLAYNGLTEEEISRANQLVDSLKSSPNSEAFNELTSLAAKAGMSVDELMQKVINGKGLENKKSYLAQRIELDQLILDKYNESVDLYADEYEKSVSKVADYRDKIEGHGIDIELFSGNMKTQLQNAMDAFDKKESAQSKADEAQKKLRDDNISFYDEECKYLENENTLLKNRADLINKEKEYLEATGQIITASTYEVLIGNLAAQKQNLEAQLIKRKAELQELETKGDLSSEDEDKYYELEGQISELEGSIYDARIQQEEYNYSLAHMPIDNLQTTIDMYNDITTAMQNWEKEITGSGQKVTSDYYQELISNGAMVIDQYNEQASLLQDLMSDYDPGSDKWNDLYKELQSCNSEISSMVQNLNEWNQALLQMPLDQFSDASDKMNQVLSGLNDVKSEYDTVISAVTGAISEYRDSLDDANQITNDEYDERIKALQDQLDLLQKQNEALQHQEALEQALYNLQKATSQKTQMVIRDGQVVYEADADAVRSATEEYQNALESLTEYKIQQQIDDLNDALTDINDIYNDQIEALDKQSEKWSEIASTIEQMQNETIATDILGSGWKDLVLNGNDEAIFNMFQGMYQSNAAQIKQYEDQINEMEKITALIESYLASYKEGTLSYQQAQSGINNLLTQINGKLSATDNMQNINGYMGSVLGTNSDFNSIYSGFQSSLDKIGDELRDSLKQYETNKDMIGDYMTNFEQLVANTDSMVNLLEEVRDNLADALDRDYDEDGEIEVDFDKANTTSSGSSSSSSSSSGSSGPGANIGGSPGAGYPTSMSGNYNVVSRKDGIEEGLTPGTKTRSALEDTLQKLGLVDLSGGGMLSVLHPNEAVFNPDQQQTLLKNFSNAWTGGNANGFLSALKANTGTNVAVSFGAVNVYEVDNAQQIADELATTVTNKLTQNFSKIFKK